MAVIPFPRDTQLQTKHRVSHLIILKVKLSHASVHTDQRQAINGDIVSNWPFPTRAVPQMRVWIWAHSIILQIVTLTTFEINAAYSRVSSVRSYQAPNISSRLTNFSLVYLQESAAIYSWGYGHTSHSCHVPGEYTDNSTWQHKKAWCYPDN